MNHSIEFHTITSVNSPFCTTDLIRWHVLHGRVIAATLQGDLIGRVYLNYFGCHSVFLHFDTCKAIQPFVFRSAANAILAWARNSFDVVFTHIPKDKNKLIRFAIAAGFARIPDADFSALNIDYAFLRLTQSSGNSICNSHCDTL